MFMINFKEILLKSSLSMDSPSEKKVSLATLRIIEKEIEAMEDIVIKRIFCLTDIFKRGGIQNTS